MSTGWDDLPGILEEIQLSKEDLNDVSRAVSRSRPPKEPERPGNYHPQPGGAWCLDAFYQLVDLVRAHVHECERVRCNFCDDLYPALSDDLKWYIDTGELSNWQGAFFPRGTKSLDEVKRRPT